MNRRPSKLGSRAQAVKIQIDGASRGNPGPSGIGIVLSDARKGKETHLALFLGQTTNNVAETCALLVALQEAARLGYRQVSVFTDSELLQRQATGVYRIKDQQLQLLHTLIQRLMKGFDRFEIWHLPREKNRTADRLANRAIAEELKRHPKLKHKAPPTQTLPAQPTFGFI